MKIPEKATGVVVRYGDDVYVESPGFPEDERGTWTVWDRRPVRQGARLVESGLTFRKAEALALEITKPSREERTKELRKLYEERKPLPTFANAPLEKLPPFDVALRMRLEELERRWRLAETPIARRKVEDKMRKVREELGRTFDENAAADERTKR